MTLCWWTRSVPRTSCHMYFSTSRSSSPLGLFSSSSSSVCGTYSKTKKILPFQRKTSMRLTMFSCLSSLRMRISRMAVFLTYRPISSRAYLLVLIRFLELLDCHHLRGLLVHSLVDQSVRPKGQTCGSPLADLVEHFIVVHYCLFVFLNISVLLYIYVILINLKRRPVHKPQDSGSAHCGSR